MTPTPLRIRGRKRNRTQVSTTQSQISAKRPCTSQTSKQLQLSQSRKKLKPKVVISAMPTLQGIPQEILEIIFLYSMNVSLPRASPDLGRKLSSRAVCMEFTLRTFFGSVNYRKAHKLKRSYLRCQEEGSEILQSELLTCRFFTWSFFLDYVQKAHDALANLRGKAWKSAGVRVPCVEAFDGLWPFKYTKINYLGIAEGFRIPEKLLHGPWTEEKASLLYVLVSLSGEIDWEGSLAGETATQGLKEAIEEGDERAVAALSVLLGVAGTITTDLIRFAVLECGCRLSILRHLLFNAQILYGKTENQSLDFHDPALWQWADQDEHGMGAILKGMLKKAEQFSLGFYFEGDTDWQGIVTFPYSGEKFDARAVLDNDAMQRELLVKLYRNHGRRITRTTRRVQVDEVVLSQTFNG
ncbi:hypothetical protein B0J11DRAFT_537515 [Dendryphion nanum]|uniref:Uncharacterized protein n=1 Tax=Dendryphion nanum TaxID=256645 RepID=A0A9P9DCE1_9PLEO|nr:hypothetical protein B0J11DRAFT_537515 [Dendryphion nanum]